eukprot:6208887-Pleurochrysis_carterae.AAC.4
MAERDLQLLPGARGAPRKTTGAEETATCATNLQQQEPLLSVWAKNSWAKLTQECGRDGNNALAWRGAGGDAGRVCVRVRAYVAPARAPRLRCAVPRVLHCAELRAREIVSVRSLDVIWRTRNTETYEIGTPIIWHQV